MGTYLITGGCGFIGSQLSHQLIYQGHKVKIIDNLSSGSITQIPDECDFFYGDINNSEYLEQLMKDIDGCYHLAANLPSEENDERLINTDLPGSINVFNLARKNKYREAIPVVYASSAVVYGDNAKVILKESDIVRPTSKYSADKVCCELHARVAGIKYEVNTIGLRFFNVYGPGQKLTSPYSRDISNLIKFIINNNPVPIPKDDWKCHDFLFINDAIDALISAMSYAQKPRKKNEIFNICSGKTTSSKVISKILLSISGKSLPIVTTSREAGYINFSSGCNQSLHKKLKFDPLIDLHTGLKQTYHYFLSHYKGVI
ncbi:MAG: NAD-dependent epimerase/dehydratase family protein [Gammaproteobacteria bacterium]|nr:NAD-dependent epimerase/dehydratase family protein [Gammaproteobacteria bacterium]